MCGIRIYSKNIQKKSPTLISWFVLLIVFFFLLFDILFYKKNVNGWCCVVINTVRQTRQDGSGKCNKQMIFAFCWQKPNNESTLVIDSTFWSIFSHFIDRNIWIITSNCSKHKLESFESSIVYKHCIQLAMRYRNRNNPKYNSHLYTSRTIWPISKFMNLIIFS